ncbi:Cyclic pyranopterin monophosphate synthase [Lachnellula willkommii]|uniref:Cyclic pyranopterin monophosphate synthase n=1 Tax=Lachnellula willkommii TaxID=215461 RepID=A0A559M2P6_9HELO|nr:Cyclic pyranopterin monophosphate synthase [Lachnellula willkommii]
MVPISTKPPTSRTAVARCSVHFSNPTPLSLIRANALKKGDVLGVARVAGIMAAKKTSELVPLCHPVFVTFVGVEVEVEGCEGEVEEQEQEQGKGEKGEKGEGGGSRSGRGFGTVEIEATVSCDGKTGVEMEALIAASTAALTVYDMSTLPKPKLLVANIESIYQIASSHVHLKRSQLRHKNESDNNMAPLKSRDKVMPQQKFTSQQRSKIRRYKEVHVILFHWQEDDMGVLYDMQTLAGLFNDTYRSSSVETHLIPSKNPYSFVERALDNFKRAHSHPESLLIVYYNGHGYLENGKMMMCAYAEAKDSNTAIPSIEWYALQVGLERTASDVLILLCTCASGGSLRSSSAKEGGVTELIAACNSTGVTPATGELTFTSALIAELQRLAIIGRTFSASELHEGMLAHIQRKSNAHEALSATQPTLQAAPVIIRLNGGHQYPSIALRAFRSNSDDNAAEIHHYQARLWKRVVDRWETSIPAKIMSAIQERKQAEVIETQTETQEQRCN